MWKVVLGKTLLSSFPLIRRKSNERKRKHDLPLFLFVLIFQKGNRMASERKGKRTHKREAKKRKKKIKWSTKVKWDPERVKKMEQYREKVRPQHEAFCEQLKRQQKAPVPNIILD